MNYITRLQQELASANTALRAKADAIQAFRTHLASSKFATPGPDSERRDWIAVTDVLNWLSWIANAEADDDTSDKTVETGTACGLGMQP